MKPSVIMIVEDDEDIRRQLGELLSDEGYQTIAAGNGQQALDKLKAGDRPDLILLDLMMPVLGAFGFREIQEMDPVLSEIPVVLMSADDNVDVKRVRVGLNYHVRKPIDIDHLLRTIEKAFTQARLSRSTRVNSGPLPKKT